jgi:hypothetical protein
MTSLGSRRLSSTDGDHGSWVARIADTVLPPVPGPIQQGFR